MDPKNWNPQGNSILNSIYSYTVYMMACVGWVGVYYVTYFIATLDPLLLVFLLEEIK